MVLFLIWLLARLALFLAFNETMFYIALVAEFLFWSYSIGFLAYLLVKSGNHRNLLFIPMLSIMMVLDISILLSAKLGDVLLAKHLMNTAVLVFTLLITLLGGRVIPFFTRNGLKNIGLEVENNNAATWVEIITPILTLITLIAYFVNYFINVESGVFYLFILCGITPHPPNKQISKTALGATHSVKWEHYKDSKNIITKLKKEDYNIISIEQVEGSTELHKFKIEKYNKIVLIFGNEIKGIDQYSIDLSDEIIEIPQYGTKHSLNISVCSGIILWEIFKKNKLIINNKI